MFRLPKLSVPLDDNPDGIRKSQLSLVSTRIISAPIIVGLRPTTPSRHDSQQHNSDTLTNDEWTCVLNLSTMWHFGRLRVMANAHRYHPHDSSQIIYPMLSVLTWIHPPPKLQQETQTTTLRTSSFSYANPPPNMIIIPITDPQWPSGREAIVQSSPS